ncbi:MAG: phosphoenolpyruvate carboxykinase (GTP) [Thermodesulfobacteriota bacterium]|nr:phosphoenolpyruvate carboxykinase (GTP) [Thermodesulfobacteriota bacterium]
MDKRITDVLKHGLGDEQYGKLARINNPDLYGFLARFIEFCNPDQVFVSSDSNDDVKYIAESAIKNGEESKLAIDGHTIHFDSFYDQGRDKEHTNILVPKEVDLGSSISTRDRQEGLKEVHEILKNIMKGKELYISFFCLGPTDSGFSIPCVQLTDSSYVAHSEQVLYRPGYDEFVRQGSSARFFKFVHSQGEVDERKVCKDLDKRRIYIDIHDDTVYSTNTQYGGNTIGLKKLAMRLAINRGSKEGWLTEHMLVLGIHGPKGRLTYFTGAFPSLCGKTSTAMLEGESIIGDDIAYLKRKDGEVKAVNVEKGMFGIIMGVNSEDDPYQWQALHRPGEIIFSNVLVTEDNNAHWIGKDGDIPSSGRNHSGSWFQGKRDDTGKEIPCSHPNARFTISLDNFENLDPKIDDPAGVPVGGIVYGGRDSDTCVPVEESFDWVHGIITKGASLESETTAATLGKEGVRAFNPMSNLDFLSVPIGKYIKDNLEFGKGLKRPPLIFSVNYFLKDREGNFLNEKTDKKVWYKWMELRVYDEVGFLETPTGKIPRYEDLKTLFEQVLSTDYTQEDYNEQFVLRVKENLAKIDRITEIYRTRVSDTPGIVFKVLEQQRQRLNRIREEHGDYVLPYV